MWKNETYVIELVSLRSLNIKAGVSVIPDRGQGDKEPEEII